VNPSEGTVCRSYVNLRRENFEFWFVPPFRRNWLLRLYHST